MNDDARITKEAAEALNLQICKLVGETNENIKRVELLQTALESARTLGLASGTLLAMEVTNTHLQSIRNGVFILSTRVDQLSSRVQRIEDDANSKSD